MKRDRYAEVSARIVAELEAGAAPWIKPWSATPGANTPCNAVTNRPYSGCNVVPLWMAQAAGYHTPRFVTTPHDETNNLTLGRSPQREARIWGEQASNSLLRFRFFTSPYIGAE